MPALAGTILIALAHVAPVHVVRRDDPVSGLPDHFGFGLHGGAYSEAERLSRVATSAFCVESPR